MDKKTALGIVKYLRTEKISDDSIQLLFFNENSEFWERATKPAYDEKEAVDNIIKYCNSQHDNST